jgi:hypothetical protein
MTLFHIDLDIFLEIILEKLGGLNIKNICLKFIKDN